MVEGENAIKNTETVNAFLVALDAEAASALAIALENTGFKVTVLRSFGEVREAVRHTVPDLLILHSMGGLGPELAFYSSLRTIIENAFVPFVVIAEAHSPEEEVMALSAGVDAYLTAPLYPVLLSARLHSLLRIKALHDELARANQRLEELSRIDPGTGLYNRRYFFERLEEEFERVKRHDDHLTVMMLDVDNFKRANDLHGHLFGDFVLRKLAGILQNTSRRIDIVARYGGEEFAFILPDTTLLAGANLAERVRRMVSSAVFKDGGLEMRITVSLGVAEARHCHAVDPDELVTCADKALYEAKSLGRNRLTIYSGSCRNTQISNIEPPPPLPPMP